MPKRRSHRPQRESGKGRAAGLSLDAVVAGALELIDTRGAAALTMRRLSAYLGVEAMSLYHYVRNRQDLLDRLTEWIVASIPRVPSTGDWAESARAFAVGIRDVALHHPEAFQLVGMRPLTEAAATRLVEPLLLSLRAGGLEPSECVVVFRLLAAFARGFSLAEIWGLTLAGTGSQQKQQQEAGFRGQIPPQLAEFESSLAGEHDAVFREGLELVLAGVRTRALAK
ncbi:MAG: TetR/AcrR family transcriptional regulator C-terminal domain-containing protein [Streptosporangiales bacterium]